MRGEIQIREIVGELERDDLLPAIVFRTARSQCDSDVEHAARAPELQLSSSSQRNLEDAIREIIRDYEMESDIITAHPQYPSLIRTAVGAHHAGQLLMWRLLLEELMAAGHLRVLVATGTVAAGVDFPARTVVITAHSKRGAEGFAALTASEFQQMSGRAGRRGKDTVGFCLAAPAPFCDARTVLKISKRPPEPLISSYFPGPSSVLNLLRYRNVDDLRFTVSRSLGSFVDRKEAKKLRAEADEALLELPPELREHLYAPEDKPFRRDERRMLKRVRRVKRQADELETKQSDLLELSLQGLQSLGYLDGMTLSAKGYWAAQLCTSLVLELAEMIDSGLFDKVSAEQLVALIASIAGDEHRQYLKTKHVSISKDDLAKISQILERVAAPGMPGVSDLRKVIPEAANTVITWMHAKDWHEFRSILILQGVAEGDAARLITQTAEQLNQLTRLSESHPELAFRAEEGKRRILRPPLTEELNLEVPA